MSRQTELYQAHLDQVSRSFAFCIEQLREPLREWVGLSYLLCRVVDTIEDAAWTRAEDQAHAFARFDRALAGDCDALVRLVLPGDVPAAEVALMNDAPALMRDFAALPPAARAIIGPLVRSMSLGMQHFTARRPLRLHDLNEVNQYCFFVAGVVGELLAGVLALVEPTFTPSAPALLGAHHFGQFLQKVNVLKDQVGDEAVGRHLVPSRTAVEASAATNVDQGFAFLRAVPRAQREFRRFCAWSLFLGLESMRVARDAAAAGRVLKVDRARTIELLNAVEAVLDDDVRLSEMFADLRGRLGWGASVALASSGVPAWFRGAYAGALSDEDLVALGI